MAINKSYVRPHTEVYQFLDKTVASTGQHLGACLIGAQYDLYRYGKEVVEGQAPGAAVANKISVDYSYDNTNPLYEYAVDKKSAQVVAEDILLKDSRFAPTESSKAYLKVDLYHYGTLRVVDADRGIANELKIAPYKGTAADTIFADRPVKVGDVLLAQVGSIATPVTVTRLVPNSDDTAYTGIEVDKLPNVESGTSDVTYIEITAVCDKYSGVLTVLESDVTDTESSHTMKVSSTVKFASDAAGTTHTIQAGYGKLYPEFRVLLGGYDDQDIIVVNSISQIQDQLGTIDVWNELAYAAWCAVQGSQGRDVYAIRVATDDLAGYKAAAKKTDADTVPYSFVPVVDGSGADDQEIIKWIVNYCNEKSDPQVQMWRQTIAGISSPGEYPVYFIDQDKNVRPAARIPYVRKDFVQLTDGKFSFRHISANGGEGQLSVGDIITIYPTLTGSDGTDYTVKQIVADNTVQLDQEVSTGTWAYITMKKANTSKNHMAWIHGLANQINDRRGVLVWCDGGVYDGKTISNAYLAAEVAGLCSAVLPQQSITLTEIQSITSCSKMYLNYTQKELDDMAAGGVLIITQDNKYGLPYIRHQLTTDPIHGSLYSEMSITRNLDNISYGVADVIRGYCGRANVTTTSLPHLRAALLDVLNGFTQDSVNDLIGPSLVRFYDLTVQQDPKHKDTVIVNVVYELPLPMNNIKVYQMVYAATVHMDDIA